MNADQTNVDSCQLITRTIKTNSSEIKIINEANHVRTVNYWPADTRNAKAAD